MNPPVKRGEIEYLLHSEANSKMIWLDGVLYDADELRDVLEAAPERIAENLSSLRKESA
jgi:hypothetical protein